MTYCVYSKRMTCAELNQEKIKLYARWPLIQERGLKKKIKKIVLLMQHMERGM